MGAVFEKLMHHRRRIEIRGLTYTHIQKDVLSFIENQSVFFPETLVRLAFLSP
jgi:hypothetical protein